LTVLDAWRGPDCTPTANPAPDTIADNESKPVGNLLFAGEHTSSFYEWQGLMEGAALSGVRAAQEAFALLRGKAAA